MLGTLACRLSPLFVCLFTIILPTRVFVPDTLVNREQRLLRKPRSGRAPLLSLFVPYRPNPRRSVSTPLTPRTTVSALRFT